MEQLQSELWTHGGLYEGYVGRWSRIVAQEFVRWLEVPPAHCWLDVGCGTGAVSQAILDLAAPLKSTGVDPSEYFIAHTREYIHDERASFDLGDAIALPYQAATFDVVVSGLVLNFISDPQRAIGEMMRVVRPGGLIAAYVWDYTDRMRLMRYFWDAAVALDPAAAEYDEACRFALCNPQPLAHLWSTAGLHDVSVQAIDVPTIFRDFNEYWSPFLRGRAPAPQYAMSLTESRRNELKERLYSMLPISADGSINLIARAWAVRGIRQQ